MTPRIAEKIQVAQTIGSLSMALRSIADNQTELDQAIASGAVNLPEGASPEEEEKLLRQAMARPQEGATTFVTGADVSRFQRSLDAAPDGRSGAAGAGRRSPAAAAPVPTGPVVRVTRGKATSVEPVATGVGALLDRQAQGVGRAGRTLPTALSTVR